MNRRLNWPVRVRMSRSAGMFAVTSVTAMVLVAGCGQKSAPALGGAPPPGVMSVTHACELVVGRAGPGFFSHPQRVRLVLTTYAKGEPVESQGDISTGMPPRTLVWVVEVHAKAIHWNHSVPPGYQPPAQPYTDYSVVLNARTGEVSDQGECRCWPLPLSEVGTVVSLSPKC
jgi:hypothetical protein